MLTPAVLTPKVLLFVNVSSYIFQSSFLGEGNVLHGNANAKVVIHGMGDMI
jgi:hypothetical protein